MRPSIKAQLALLATLKTVSASCVWQGRLALQEALLLGMAVPEALLHAQYALHTQ